MKNTKRALLLSIRSITMCLAMLVGSTFAWFTDSASTGVNTITAGNLNVGLEYSTDMKTWHNAENADEIFGTDALWEPGYTQVLYFRVSNNGSLDLKYRVGTNIVENIIGKTEGGADIDLTQHIKFGIVDVNAAFADRATAKAAVTPIDFNNFYVAEKTLLNGDKATFAMVAFMPETVGNDANHNGVVPSIKFGINVIASQMVSEEDSFGSDYDTNAAYPQVGFATLVINSETVINGDKFKATVPTNAGLKTEDGTAVTGGTELVMQIDKKATVDSNVTVNIGSVAETYEVTLKTVTDEKVSSTEPITVEMQIGKGRVGAISLYHNDILVEGTSYNAETGILTFKATDFSPYTVVEAVFTVDTDWYDAEKDEFTITTVGEFYGFAALVNSGEKFVGQTVKLNQDIDLDNMTWTPIGKGNTNSFQGVFDGQNHTISNLNAVTASGWYNGLFGYVKNIEGNPAAIVKNFTVNNAKVTGNAHSSAVVIGEVFCANVENVTVKGDVTVNGAAYTGGIVGKGYASITNCHITANEGGVISSVSSYLGGIMGHRGEGSSYDINGCSIKNVTITGSSIVGGIAGISQNGNKITNCTLENVTVVYKNVSDPADQSGVGAISGWSSNNVSLTGNSFKGTIQTPYTLYNDKVTGLGFNGAAQTGLVLDNNTINATVIAQ